MHCQSCCQSFSVPHHDCQIAPVQDRFPLHQLRLMLLYDLVDLGHLRLVLGEVGRQLVHLARVTGQVNHHRGGGAVHYVRRGQIGDLYPRAVVGALVGKGEDSLATGDK